MTQPSIKAPRNWFSLFTTVITIASLNFSCASPKVSSKKPASDRKHVQAPQVAGSEVTLRQAAQNEAIKKITSSAVEKSAKKNADQETHDPAGSPPATPSAEADASTNSTNSSSSANTSKGTDNSASAAIHSANSAESSGEKKVIDSSQVTSSAAPAASTHDAGPAVSAEKSLQWLKNGNTRYVKRYFRADGRTDADRKRLTSGQHPHAIILSCADSRVPPEIIFDQTLGEIFTIRVAGEALDSSVLASIEYAVEHLGPKLLIVMGHTKCGAVDTALKIKEGTSAGSESLDKLLADIRPRLRSVSSERTSPNLEVESTLNADGVARDIVTRSELIRKKMEAGELVIKPALYRLDSGKVVF